MTYREWKNRTRFRWRERVSRRHGRRGSPDPPLIRHISWFNLYVPPKGLAGFLMALLPFVLAAGLFYPAWREMLVLAGVIALSVWILRRRSPR